MYQEGSLLWNLRVGGNETKYMTVVYLVCHMYDYDLARVSCIRSEQPGPAAVRPRWFVGDTFINSAPAAGRNYTARSCTRTRSQHYIIPGIIYQRVYNILYTSKQQQ